MQAASAMNSDNDSSAVLQLVCRPKCAVLELGLNGIVCSHEHAVD